jgi:hypothetical protein
VGYRQGVIQGEGLLGQFKRPLQGLGVRPTAVNTCG